MTQYENFYSTKLTAPLLAGDTIVQVVKAPQVATQGWIILEPRNATQREIVWFSGVSGNTLTGVQRGQQGTMNVGHPAGVVIEQNPTAQDFEDALNVNSNIPQAIRDVFGDSVNEATFAANAGLVWSAATGLNAGMTAGAVYINGVRVAVAAVVTRLFVASRDTYVDVDINGVLIYTPVTVGATAPTKAVNTVRLAKVTTSATAVTAVSDIREKPVKAQNVDFKTFTKRYARRLGTTSTNPSGAIVVNSSFTFTAPFDGVCVCSGSIPVRYDSTTVNDARTSFRVGGSALPTTQSVAGRTITQGGTAGMYDTSPYGYFNIVKGSTYTVDAVATGNTSTVIADGNTGYVEYELISSLVGYQYTSHA